MSELEKMELEMIKFEEVLEKDDSKPVNSPVNDDFHLYQPVSPDDVTTLTSPSPESFGLLASDKSFSLESFYFLDLTLPLDFLLQDSDVGNLIEL